MAPQQIKLLNFKACMLLVHQYRLIPSAHSCLCAGAQACEVTIVMFLMHGSCPLQVMVWDADVNKAISHVLEIEKDLQANMKIE